MGTQDTEVRRHPRPALYDDGHGMVLAQDADPGAKELAASLPGGAVDEARRYLSLGMDDYVGDYEFRDTLAHMFALMRRDGWKVEISHPPQPPLDAA